MTYPGETKMNQITAEISKITGLYEKWAQRHKDNYCTVKIIFSLQTREHITQKQISEMYEIPKQTINNVVRQLKKDDYITLMSSDEDKRAKKIILTEQGKEYARDLLEPIFTLDEKVVKRIGMPMLQQLLEAVTVFGDALEAEMELDQQLHIK